EEGAKPLQRLSQAHPVHHQEYGVVGLGLEIHPGREPGIPDAAVAEDFDQLGRDLDRGYREPPLLQRERVAARPCPDIEDPSPAELQSVTFEGWEIGRFTEEIANGDLVPLVIIVDHNRGVTPTLVIGEHRRDVWGPGSQIHETAVRSE